MFDEIMCRACLCFSPSNCYDGSFPPVCCYCKSIKTHKVVILEHYKHLKEVEDKYK